MESNTALSKSHKYFIQYMIKRGSVSEESAINFMSQFEIDTIIKLKNLVNDINPAIANQYYKIIFTTCEVTETPSLVWINMKKDEASEILIDYTEKDLEYFRKLVCEILNSEYRKLSYVAAVNISSLVKLYSRSEAEDILDDWLEIGYFVKHSDNLYFGPKTLHEFATVLKSNRPECVCYLCSEVSITGKICNECDKIFHSYCINQYIENHQKCPNCKNQWFERNTFRNEMEEESHMDTQDMEYMNGEVE